jgi:hypothetical protein
MAATSNDPTHRRKSRQEATQPNDQSLPTDKGTPATRPVRKAKGLTETARLPKRSAAGAMPASNPQPPEGSAMRSTHLIPVAVLAFAAACTESASNPMTPIDSQASGSAHFIKNATSCTLNGLNLVCTFKEAGLESGSSETITLAATGTATYECFNNGEKHPRAANKETVSAELSVSGEFTADKNGNVTGTLTLSPPGPGGFACPPGQDLVGPTNVSYTSVGISDADTGGSINISGTF